MKIDAFSKTYDGKTVLDFPGTELKKGKIYCIIGANGSGKSTFAKVLSGTIAADDRKKPAEGFSIGYMPQKHYAFRMSTYANILLGKKDKDRAAELMNALQIAHLYDKRADRLSGGETARMALARLMMCSYDLVILDEPTAAMDVETTSLAEKEVLRYVQETGCALVLVTHSLRQAKRLADEVFFFHEGRLLESGMKQELLQNPKLPETRQFLDFYGG